MAVAVPVTVPYVRYSIKSAHWFIARALAALLQGAGLAKDAIDGLCVSGFLLFPDTAVGLTQHLGLSPRWLDHIPMGGASGVVALRRAARAVQAGDAEIVACIAGDTNHVDSFRHTIASFSQFARDAVLSLRLGRPECELRVPYRLLHAHHRRAARGLRQAVRRAARQRAQLSARAVQEAAVARGIPRRPADRRTAAPIRLRHAVRGRGGVPGHERSACAGARARRSRACSAPSSGTTPFPMTRSRCAAAGRSIAMRSMRRPAWDQRTWTSCELYDDYPVITAMQLEDLGFCEKGAAAPFIRANTFTVDGSLPLNTSGGQLSVGQAGAAGGYLGLIECLRQLTGRALGAQVPQARHGLVSGFGMINYDRGLCSGAAVLAGART